MGSRDAVVHAVSLERVVREPPPLRSERPKISSSPLQVVNVICYTTDHAFAPENLQSFPVEGNAFDESAR